MKKKLLPTVLLCTVAAVGLGAGTTGCNIQPAHTHSYIESVIPPTCTQNGYTLHQCVCGDNYRDNEVAATGHNEVTVEGAAATCTEDGLTDGKRCTVCNTETVPQQTVKATGHDYVNGKCTVCGEADPDVKYTEVLEYAAIEEDGQTVGYAVTGISDTTVEFINIPTEYEGLPVMKIASKAFYGNDNVKNVIVPDSVEEIQTMAFYWCSALESLQLGKSVKIIGTYALGGCFSLTSIEIDPENATLKSEGNCIIERETMTVIEGCAASVIPASAKAIADYAFAYHAAPENVVLPASMEKVGDYAFYYAYNIKTLTVPSNVASIGAYAFSRCSSLEAVDIDCASVGTFAFSTCPELCSLTVGENVTTLTGSRFTSCYKLIDVYNKSSLPLTNSTTTGNNYALPYSRNLYTDADKKGEFTVVDGYKFYTFKNSDGNNENYLIGYGGDNTQLTLPSPTAVKFNGKGITDYGINSYAFYGNTDVTSLVIPDGVTHIYAYAFGAATNLNQVTVAESVGYVELNAFRSCTALTSVNWNAVECTTNVDLSQNSITNITAQNRIFYGCNNLQNVVFGNNVKRIPEGIFRGCEGITSVVIPSSVTTIGAAAFYYCTNLESVTFADKASSWSTAFNADGTGSTSNPPKTVTPTQISSPLTAAQMLAALEDYKYSGYGTNYWFKQS